MRTSRQRSRSHAELLQVSRTMVAAVVVLVAVVLVVLAVVLVLCVRHEIQIPRFARA